MTCEPSLLGRPMNLNSNNLHRRLKHIITSISGANTYKAGDYWRPEQAQGATKT